MSRHTKASFTSSGSWTVPAGVTTVVVIGTGGGGGGAGSTDVGGSSTAGQGGNGSGFRMQFITVIPDTTYTVTIGSGGSGGVGASNGSDGTDTTLGALVTFAGSTGGKYEFGQYLFDNRYDYAFYPYNEGGISSAEDDNTNSGGSLNGFIVGDVNPSASDRDSGGGGGAGGRGDGADGGYPDLGTGSHGDSAGANTGAGGGGSGQTGSANGTGGSGGSGYLEIVWLD